MGDTPKKIVHEVRAVGKESLRSRECRLTDHEKIKKLMHVRHIEHVNEHIVQNDGKREKKCRLDAPTRLFYFFGVFQLLLFQRGSFFGGAYQIIAQLVYELVYFLKRDP